MLDGFFPFQEYFCDCRWTESVVYVRAFLDHGLFTAFDTLVCWFQLDSKAWLPAMSQEHINAAPVKG